MSLPVALDVDGAIGALPGATTLPMRDWEEALRFASSPGTMRRFKHFIDGALPARHGTVFTGSGDFHHLTWPLVERMHDRGPFQVVVLDNHPDNMRFPWGVHCGSWVRRIAALPFVMHVHVVGITSSDIGRGHAWENYWGPLRAGKLTYWSTDVDVSWAGRVGMGDAFRPFSSPAELVDAFIAAHAATPTYLSIDKDVFAHDVAHTNWDQGRFMLEHALDLIGALNGRIVGSDITGEVSHYAYRSWWKRRLSSLDGQPMVGGAELASWQNEHHALNLRLLSAIEGSIS